MLSNYGSIVTREQDILVENLDSKKSCWNKVKYLFLSCFKREAKKTYSALDIKNHSDARSFETRKYETFDKRQNDNLNDQKRDTGHEQELNNKDSFGSKAYLMMLFTMDDDTESSTSGCTGSPINWFLEVDFPKQNNADGGVVEVPAKSVSSEEWFIGADLAELKSSDNSIVKVNFAESEHSEEWFVGVDLAELKSSDESDVKVGLAESEYSEEWVIGADLAELGSSKDYFIGSDSTGKSDVTAYL
ncbi:hypothetical protein phytr_12010 [Candidatus Phycorickettsia trachydisci]|uniref:Uncharacterized protein n=1 Tax=Candidatus Phycorickettsia trachydisci TaxID=2115978 RepID=A0A2P1PA56_9RICK|nr:hypothetical protein [Candidatus Phycorickettsia trachydisci]AVP88126.1 hypothetical protein phytr_12010 [Candidatus Phycorickettsia trachydisci]